ncbi:IS1-like element transposase [Vibrio diabolicus]
MSINSSGVRVTAQVLNVAYNTVLSTLKNLAKVSNLNPFR